MLPGRARRCAPCASTAGVNGLALSRREYHEDLTPLSSCSTRTMTPTSRCGSTLMLRLSRCGVALRRLLYYRPRWDATIDTPEGRDQPSATTGAARRAKHGHLAACIRDADLPVAC